MATRLLGGFQRRPQSVAAQVEGFTSPPLVQLGGQISGKFNENQAGRFNRFVQKLTAIKGGAPMPTVASDLQFMHPLFFGIELLYLQGWDVFYSANAFAGSAGNKSVLELRNPVSSNVIAVVERINAYSTAATDTIQVLSGFNITFDQPTALNPLRSLDSRGRAQSTCILSSSQAGVGTTFGFVYASITVTANVSIELLRPGEEIVMLPGTAIGITSPNNAAPLNTGVLRIRERFLEDSERT